MKAPGTLRRQGTALRPPLAPPAGPSRHRPPANMPLRSIGFYLAPQFSMISLMCTIEPLRIANELLGQSLFTWELISKDGNRVPAVNGLDLPVHRAIADCERFDALAVCASYDLPGACDPHILAWLRLMERRGVRIGAVDTGSHVLAKAGLLTGYRCTIHWQNLEAFERDFPELNATSNLYEIDGNRFTCGGATAALDMMLHLIAIEYGARLSLQVSEQLIYARLRQDHDNQRSSVAQRLQVHDAKLSAVLAEMENNIEVPLAIGAFAGRAGITLRQLERLFEQHFGTSPSRYYADLRLTRARSLLKQTSMPVLDVALTCGFPSYAHFSRSYTRLFGQSPTRERKGPFRGARA
ncbi:GlxA family transcriptional regulator [Labrys monachus]|uniref:Transcriptional regulator GlxA family with amidase domain n=1 Tax=Labrys monachus TaxID=217067 RepID=A0ABU0FBF9_9HYPH|nr:GlxA family transcriptional regulator [Labrys monachus]MDQ0391943.1 transcriptional regulator GlxA family with amidase domain [Labrys monachus]